MKSILKNLLLVVLAVLAGYLLATYFGQIYNYFVPQNNDSIFSLSQKAIYWLAGFPFAYTLFIPFLFQAFGAQHKKTWVIVLLVPAALLWLASDLAHIYLPVILGAIGWFLGKGINKIFSKSARVPSENKY